MIEPQHDRANGQDDADLARSLSTKRRQYLLAVLAFAVLAGLAFFYLHSGRIEGGAFVSMLTLAFGVGLVVLIWQRITHITILGSEIKLQRLTQEAETLVGELDTGKADLYRTALGVMKHSAQTTEDEGRALSERSAILVELLGNIEKARLLEVLDDEALSATDRTIDELLRNMSHQTQQPDAQSSASLTSRAEAVIEQLDEGALIHGRQGVRGGNGDALNSELTKTVEDLKTLLHYRRRIQEMRNLKGLETTKTATRHDP